MIMRLAAVVLLVWNAGFGLGAVQGTIKGSVSDKGGKPIENVTINIASMEFTSLNLDVKTDQRGQFIEVRVQSGYYQIKAQKKGYLPQVFEMRVGNQQALEVRFCLEEGQSDAPESSGDEDFKVGNEWFAKEIYEEATKSYLEAIAKEPNEPIFYNNLGIAYLNLERIDEALEVYKKMLEVQPNSYSAHKMVGELHSLKEEFRQALPYLDRAVELSPDDPNAVYNLGLCLLNSGANSQSLEVFKRSIKLNPDYAMAYYQIGMIYVNQHRKEEAIHNLEKFLMLAPNNPDADVARKIIEYLKTTRF